MTRTIFRAIWLISSLTLCLSLFGVGLVSYQYWSQQQERMLDSQLQTLVQIAEQQGEQSLESLDSIDFRLTLVDEEGRVTYDSEKNAKTLMNHGQREEILEAQKTGYGESTRYSTTMTEQTVYRARQLSSGTVLRLAVQFTSFLGTLKQFFGFLLVIFLLSLFAAYYMAKLIAKRIMVPVNKIDLNDPLSSQVYNEFAPLLHRMDFLNETNRSQLQQIQQNEKELQFITDQMAEGLVILNRQDEIMLLNQSAITIFQAVTESKGKPFYQLYHAYDLQQTLTKAKETGRATYLIEEQDRTYQLTMNRVDDEQTYMGLVLLVVDVTEQKRLEKMRREFTANVSHELKTPLQTIMGASELLANNMVPEDKQERFVNHIQAEAKRLLKLIDDVIKLSQLDEQNRPEDEVVDLRAILRPVLDSLQETAQLKDIRLEAKLISAAVKGSTKILTDVFYNLVENAIKYSPADSQVILDMEIVSDQIKITVSDQGEGIALEQQERIFERFYRVDKSHSRKTGGTGLGLSIVKNGVDYHKGQLVLTSQLGQGSQFTVQLPLVVGQEKLTDAASLKL
ncbi:sensor histidine kinase [Streptococcus merionis]|uniref:histidine kinase n=1 Tax=Streptococcus merionis TaxID=400065 RepID=A0A239SNI6_9STRE|nr:ATP-binding protein [Streptococcus merionis]SNU86223.1 two-component system, OmpR family, phosphate regulon sensor histidine kinase PhoR [Streptococcus merionis]